VPIGPKVQYAEEKKWDNLEIRIYQGANGEFTLYEDENDNYNYEKGMHSTIKFSWNEANKTLTIADRQWILSRHAVGTKLYAL
jgi:alpha-D-xyloside xylohydrolase